MQQAILVQIADFAIGIPAPGFVTGNASFTTRPDLIVSLEAFPALGNGIGNPFQSPGLRRQF
jgi:hypothetical protein